MCYAIGSKHLSCSGGRTRLESRIKNFNLHLIYTTFSRLKALLLQQPEAPMQEQGGANRLDMVAQDGADAQVSARLVFGIWPAWDAWQRLAYRRSVWPWVVDGMGRGWHCVA